MFELWKRFADRAKLIRAVRSPLDKEAIGSANYSLVNQQVESLAREFCYKINEAMKIPGNCEKLNIMSVM